MGLNIDLATQSGKAGSPAMSNMRSENERIETGGKIRERGQAVGPLRGERLVVESRKGQEARVKRTDLWIGLRECEVRHGPGCAWAQRNGDRK